MSRLGLNDLMVDVVTNMSEGNPGAINVMMTMLANGQEIDPQFADPIVAIMLLDTYEIYGSSIFNLYKYQCKQDIRLLLMLIRAVQLGFLDSQLLKARADDQTHAIQLTDYQMKVLDVKVCDALDAFAK